MPEHAVAQIRHGVRHQSRGQIDLDHHPQSAEPLSGHRRGRQPTTATIKVRHRPGPPYGRDRARISREPSVSTVIPGLTSEAIGAGAFNGSGSLAPSWPAQSCCRSPARRPSPAIRTSFRSTPRASICSKPPTTGISSSSTAASVTTNTTSAPAKVGTPDGLGSFGMELQSRRSSQTVAIASLYAAYGTSSEPVGAEFDGTSANYGGLNPIVAGQSDFRPEQSRAEEVGTKWELFDRHLLATGALFRTDVTMPARRSRRLRNAGTIMAGAAYHVQGIDLGATGKITDKWSVYAGFVLMKTRWTSRRFRPISASARLHRQPILQPADEIPAHRHHRSRRAGDLPIADLRRDFAGGEPGTVLPGYWRFDSLPRRQGQQELEVETVRQQHLQQALLRRLLSKRGAVRSRRAGSGPRG